jgi:tetratricopeptide (TPR) repeat protein
LVFSSKAASPYTQLFLTHIDEQGESTPPVVLANFTAPDRAANIPEFVNTRPDSIERIREQFLDDNSFVRSAYVLEVNGDVDPAIAKYQKALEVNAKNAYAHQRLGFLLFNQKRQFQEGLAHTRTSLQLNPADGCAHYDLGMALKYQGQLEPAIEHLAAAVRLLPAGWDRRYNPVDMQCSLGEALLDHGEAAPSATAFATALSHSPTNAAIEYRLAMALAAQGLTDEAVKHYALVQRTQPQVDTSAHFHLLLAANYVNEGRTREALGCAERALQIAQVAGDPQLVRMVRQQIEDLRAGFGQR